MKFAEIEGRFYALVTAPQSVAATLAARGPDAAREIDALVNGDDRLSATERLDVYANRYFLRIHDMLRDELPRTANVVGPDAFHDLVTDYLVACPPSHPSLREVGARLPAFLAEHRLAREREWLAELARLERVRLELVDGPDADPLTADDTRAIDPERFVTAPLGLVPCHALLENDHAIAPLWRALSPPWEPQAGAPTSGGGLGHANADFSAPHTPETLLVWRRGNEIRHRPVEGEERAWLRRLASQATFEELCDLAPSGTPTAEAAGRAFERLGRFIADGLVRVL